MPRACPAAARARQILGNVYNWESRSIVQCAHRILGILSAIIIW